MPLLFAARVIAGLLLVGSCAQTDATSADSTETAPTWPHGAIATTANPHATDAELSRLKNEWMSEAIVDTGSPRIGRRLNDVEEVNCPRGHGPMQKRADQEQRHICYEQCETCHGIYLDAGEFTDLKFITLLDWVKGQLA